jgi:hypothetical protein
LLTKLALMALAESMRTLSLGGMVLPVVLMLARPRAPARG